MREALSAWLSQTWGEPVTVEAVTRIGTGHSRAMYVVTLADERRFVLRCEQGGVFGTSGAEECRVMSSLARVGFPVAEVVADEPTGAVIGRPFFLMAYLDAAATMPSDERAVDEPALRDFVARLRQLHALDGSGFGFDLVPPDPTRATGLQVERWRSVYRASCDEPIPLLEEAAAWLTHHAPALGRLSVVHGDAGPGNFVHAGGAVVAFTDWEFAHLGDPTEDWVFCVTMRGSRTVPRERWIELMAEVGVALSDDEWRYWEAFNLFKGACANRTCLTLFESGVNPAPNMAIIGTTLHQIFLRRLVSIVHA